MSNKIFLPIQFNSTKLIFLTLKKLILKEKINISSIEVRNHPSCSGSRKHLILISKLKKIINESKIYRKKKTNISIFIGPTGSIIEALERDVKVYHICEIPETECYNKKIWKYINTTQISEHLFQYKRIKKNKLINLSKSINIYKSYF